MPRFMMFMYPVISDEEYAEGPSLEDVEAMTRYNEELTKAGALLAADGLHPEASRVSASGVTDGPFSEAKELVGGYWIIQAKDREEAVEWAKRVPAGRPARSSRSARSTSCRTSPRTSRPRPSSRVEPPHQTSA